MTGRPPERRRRRGLKRLEGTTSAAADAILCPVFREARRLVEQLKVRGYSSPYLERLRAHLDVEERHDVLEAEVRREMALALGRSAARVDLALLELELSEGELRASTGEARPEARRRYLEARERALTARLDLRIHREAIGIRRNERLDVDYPIPPIPAEARGPR